MGEACDDRQPAARGAILAGREDMRDPAGATSVADAQEELVVADLELELDLVAAVASVKDRVRDQFARHDQNVVYALPIDPAVTQGSPQRSRASPTASGSAKSDARASTDSPSSLDMSLWNSREACVGTAAPRRFGG
jgi:hypothetical protein